MKGDASCIDDMEDIKSTQRESYRMPDGIAIDDARLFNEKLRE